MLPQQEIQFSNGLAEARAHMFDKAEQTLSGVETARRAGIVVHQGGPSGVSRQLEYARVLTDGGLAFVDGVCDTVYGETIRTNLEQARTSLANLAISRFNQALTIYNDLRAPQPATMNGDTVPIDRVALAHARTLGRLACTRTLDGVLALQLDDKSSEQERATATRGFYYMADQKFAEIRTYDTNIGYERALNAMRAARHEWIFTRGARARWNLVFGHWIFGVAGPALASTWRQPEMFAKTLGMILNRALDFQPGISEYATDSVIDNF